MRPVELGWNLAQPAFHGCDRTPEREVLVSRWQGKGADAFAAEDRLDPFGGSCRRHDHAPDCVGEDTYRHEHEAFGELCVKSVAQHVDDRLLSRVEDERDRVELEGLDLAFNTTEETIVDVLRDA